MLRAASSRSPAEPAPRVVRSAPSTARGQQSRRRILDAAEKVFGEKGYFAASINDITREAGIALGSFYVYFQSKHEVFVEVLESLAQLIRQATRAALPKGAGRLEEEVHGFRAFFSLISRHPQLYRIVRQAEVVAPDALRAYYEAIVPRYAGRLRAAMKRGEIRRTEPEVLVYCLLGVGDLVGMRWPYWTRKPIPPKVFDAVMQFVHHGIAAEPARTARRRSREVTT